MKAADTEAKNPKAARNLHQSRSSAAAIESFQKLCGKNVKRLESHTLLESPALRGTAPLQTTGTLLRNSPSLLQVGHVFLVSGIQNQ